MPDPLELPWVGRAVVPLMCPRDAIVRKLVVDRFPRGPAIVRTLYDLAEPATALRGIEPVRVRWRPLQVVDLPAREVRPADSPRFPLSVRRQDERALPRPNQYPHAAHAQPPALATTRALTPSSIERPLDRQRAIR